MKTLTAGSLAALVVLVSAGPAPAHHSLVSFDTSTPVRVKGTVRQFHAINPHSIIYLEEVLATGDMRRWAVEGPAGTQLRRRGIPADVLKPGDAVQVCGYAPKEHIVWQIASSDPGAVSLSGRLLNAEVLVMPDGREENWGDYGVHKCFPPDYRDQHSR